MRKKRIFHTLWLAVLLGLVTQASATPFDLGTTSIEIPEPAGFVEVSPRMRQLWQIVEAGQGYNRIIAFYIPENKKLLSQEKMSPFPEASISRSNGVFRNIH